MKLKVERKMSVYQISISTQVFRGITNLTIQFKRRTHL